MRIATYNVENMFRRPAAMNQATWADGSQAITDLNKLNELINRPVYTASVKSSILTIMGNHPGLLTQGKSKFLRLQEIREKLVRKRAAGPVIEVGGRADWVGWFELVEEDLDDVAILNTARIIQMANADVQCVVEAENRTALDRFNTKLLADVGGTPYEHTMLIDGNDERGIDVGLMHRAPIELDTIVTHVDDRDLDGRVFSRDCPEYLLVTPAGNRVLILVNHFKSQLPPKAASDAKRFRQATRVREIYEQRKAQGFQFIVILGDLNDRLPADAASPLGPLLFAGSDLVEIMSHPLYTSDGRNGTFGNGSPTQKLDYILMSPAFAANVTGGGIVRDGVWGGTNGTLFPHLPEITKPGEAASDHALLFVDVNL